MFGKPRCLEHHMGQAQARTTMTGHEDHEEGLDERSSSTSAIIHQDQEDRLVPYTPFTYKAFDALHQFMNHITSQPARSAAERQAHREEIERQRALLPQHQAHRQPGVNEETPEDVIRQVLRRASLQEDPQEHLEHRYLDSLAFVDAMEVIPGPDTSNTGAQQTAVDSQHSSSQESSDSVNYYDSIEYHDSAMDHDEQEPINAARYDQSVETSDHTVDDAHQSDEEVDSHHESIQTSTHDVDGEEQESEEVSSYSYDPNIEISDRVAVYEEQESEGVISDHGSTEVSDHVVSPGDRAVDRNKHESGEATIDHESIEVSDHVVDNGESHTIDDKEDNQSAESPLRREVEPIEQHEHIPTVLSTTRVAGHEDTSLMPQDTDSVEPLYVQAVDIDPIVIKVTPPSREAPPASTVQRPSPGTLLPVAQVIKLRVGKTALQTLRTTSAPVQETSPLTTVAVTPSPAEVALTAQPQEQLLSQLEIDPPSTTATLIIKGLRIEPPVRAWSTYGLPQLIPGSLELYMPGLGNLPTSYTVEQGTNRRRATRHHMRTRQDEFKERHFAATVSEELRRGGLVEPWI